MELLVDAHDLGPGLLKEAGIVPPLSVQRYDIPNSADLAKLANADFAVVMVGGGRMFRKFACMNPGVAWLNAHYLADAWDGMPKTAAAVAGMRLLEAMGDLPPPPRLIEKMSYAIHPHPDNGVLMEIDGVPIVDIEKTAMWGAISKGIKTLGGHIAGTGAKLTRDTSKRVVSRTSTGIGTTVPKGTEMVGATRKYTGKGLGDWTKYHGGRALQGIGGAIAKNPGAAAAVGGGGALYGANRMMKSASASGMTLLNEKYPVETREQVKQASDYFEDHWKRFHPADRREFCVNLVKAASAHQLTGLPERVTKYAGQGISMDVLLHLRTRGALVDDRGRSLLTKMAEAIPHSDADSFAETLTEFDEHYGLAQRWDESLPDPYAAVCTEKLAEEYTWAEGVDRCTETDLKKVCERDIGQIKQTFGEDVALQFVKDPVAVFKSLPDPQKRIVARIAGSSNSGGTVSAA